MPINARISGDTRQETVERGKRIHPYLRPGDRHRAVFDAIVAGNKLGGVTKPQIKSATHLFHPQLLADLVAAKLVKGLGKRNGYVVYIADESQTGVYVQKLKIDVEVYETEQGNFYTVTKINGRRKSPPGDNVKRFLGKRTIHYTVPLPLDEGVMEVINSEQPDNAENVIGTKEEPCIIDN